ncbi:MAG: ATP-binding protein [Prochloraceae cyanobacterium]|nr:ATP-binding protein [Prochloraceae cyanobacterium]
MFNRSRLNLASWFALSMGSIVIVFAGIIYYFEIEDKLEAFDMRLYKKTRSIAAKSSYSFARGRWQLELEDTPLLGTNSSSLNNELIYARWYNSKGELLQFVGLPADGQLVKIDKARFETIELDTTYKKENSSLKKLRQITIPVFSENTLVGYLQVATPLKPLQKSLEPMLLFLSLGVPLTLTLVGLTGWFLGGIAMRPIEHSYEQLQRFTADASHELRTPLAAILSNVQVALMPSLQNTSQQRLCLEEIEKATKSMSNLITNLLFLARNQGKLTSAALETINLVDLLRSLSDRQTAVAKELKRNLEITLPQQPVTLKANSELLQRAIANLLDNALKYTSPGGTVKLRLFTRSRRAIIEIEDDGIGIPSTDLPHIFDRFYRVDVARSRSTGGFGLGLSIVHQIVEAHGGKISVNSTTEEGTTFKIELPFE